MSSAVRSFRKIYERNYEISWNFYLKGINYACTEALLFGPAKRVSRERVSERRSREGQRKGELATIAHKISFVLRSDERGIPLAEKWRSGKQSWLIIGQAGTLFVCVTSLVLRGIRLAPRTCFSPQSRRRDSFDLVLANRILRAEEKSDRVCSSCGRKTKTLHQLYSFASIALFSSENEKSESEERLKRPVQALPSNVGFFARLNSTG